jgi:hypothetical protein
MNECCQQIIDQYENQIKMIDECHLRTMDRYKADVDREYKKYMETKLPVFTIWLVISVILNLAIIKWYGCSLGGL